MKVQTIKQVLNSVPKRLAATFGVAAIVLVPLGLYAWGPSRDTYTMQKPADKVTFNSITDNPDVGDERNFLRVRDSDSKNWGSNSVNGWTDTISNMQEGHTYDVRLYVHNNAAANLNLEAKNVRAKINLPTKETTWGKQFEINGYLYSENATPTEIWDNIVLKSDKEFHVKIVSAKYYNNIRTEKSEGWNLNQSDLLSKGSTNGALLGYKQMDGKIPGCLQYSGYVLVKIQPVFQFVAKPSYDVEKTVDKTTAKPSETINYTINVKNTGNVDLTNVKVADNLPAYYSEAQETITSKNGSTGSIVKDGQLTLTKLNVGETATIKISYKVKAADQLECGETKIVNKATGTTDQDDTEDRTDNNEVTTTVNKDCTVVSKPSYDVFKTVDKSVANPGDTVYYIIGITNTGNVELTNATLTDVLPQYYSKVTGEVTAKHGYKDTITKDGKIVFEKLEVGETATVKLSYKLKDANQFDCGTTQINNKVSGVTDETQTEDKTDNNEVSTNVNKECTPVVPPETPENPETPTTPTTPESPTVIARTGAGETIATMIGLGAIAAAITAYIRSRKFANR
ncbi:MAG: hypothetical protein Q4C83_01440 [Candidatus Saccharibacteria bacterium]|nr:hypothetical protein [Candidatus Saccharibacteria bacterium]